MSPLLRDTQSSCSQRRNVDRGEPAAEGSGAGGLLFNTGGLAVREDESESGAGRRDDCRGRGHARYHPALHGQMAEWSILCHVHFTTIQKSRNSSTNPGAPPARDPHTETTESLRAFQPKSVSQASDGTRPEGPHAARPGDRCVKSGLFIHCKHHSRQWEISCFQWLGRLSRRAPSVLSRGLRSLKSGQQEGSGPWTEALPGSTPSQWPLPGSRG